MSRRILPWPTRPIAAPGRDDIAGGRCRVTLFRRLRKWLVANDALRNNFRPQENRDESTVRGTRARCRHRRRRPDRLFSLLFRIAGGEMLGKDQPVILQLLEIPDDKAQKALKGVMMELDDCAFPLLSSLVSASDPNSHSAMPTSRCSWAPGRAVREWRAKTCSRPTAPDLHRPGQGA